MIVTSQDAKIEQVLQNTGLKAVDDAQKSYHNVGVTRESIKQLLANGTPDWVKHPGDYKNFVKESFAAEKEASDFLVRDYKMEDQEELVDIKARLTNVIGARDFMKKVRDSGVKCYVIYNGMPGTVGFWCATPTLHGLDAKYISFLQVPAMPEWSVLRLDKHGLPSGEDYRGWRTVLAQMIKKGVYTEERAHALFGKPMTGVVSRRYNRDLYEFRNRKWVNEEVPEGYSF